MTTNSGDTPAPPHPTCVPSRRPHRCASGGPPAFPCRFLGQEAGIQGSLQWLLLPRSSRCVGLGALHGKPLFCSSPRFSTVYSSLALCQLLPGVVRCWHSGVYDIHLTKYHTHLKHCSYHCGGSLTLFAPSSWHHEAEMFLCSLPRQYEKRAAAVGCTATSALPRPGQSAVPGRLTLRFAACVIAMSAWHHGDRANLDVAGRMRRSMQPIRTPSSVTMRWPTRSYRSRAPNGPPCALACLPPLPVVCLHALGPGVHGQPCAACVLSVGGMWA